MPFWWVGALGRGYNMTNSERLNRVFYVVSVPDDVVLGRPLWNTSAAFNVADVAGMMLDGGLPDGTRLRYADGTHWLVQMQELRQIDGPRRMRPRETSKTERMAWMEEVRKCQ